MRGELILVALTLGVYFLVMRMLAGRRVRSALPDDEAHGDVPHVPRRNP
jgi:hypothetical protein